MILFMAMLYVYALRLIYKSEVFTRPAEIGVYQMIPMLIKWHFFIVNTCHAQYGQLHFCKWLPTLKVLHAISHIRCGIILGFSFEQVSARNGHLVIWPLGNWQPCQFPTNSPRYPPVSIPSAEIPFITDCHNIFWSSRELLWWCEQQCCPRSISDAWIWSQPWRILVASSWLKSTSLASGSLDPLFLTHTTCAMSS